MIAKIRKNAIALLALVAAVAAFLGNIDTISNTLLGYEITPLVARTFDLHTPIGYVLLVEAEVPGRIADGGASRGSTWSLSRPLSSMVTSNFEKALSRGGYNQLSFHDAKELKPADIVRVSAEKVMVLSAEEVTNLYRSRRSRYNETFTFNGSRARNACLLLVGNPINYINRTVYIDDIVYISYWAKVADEPCPE